MWLVAVPTRSQRGGHHREYKRKQPPALEVQRGGGGPRDDRAICQVSRRPQGTRPSHNGWLGGLCCLRHRVEDIYENQMLVGEDEGRPSVSF